MKLDQEQGATLLAWARARLRQELGGAIAARPRGAWCERPGASFVTLRWADTGDLQGCIGSLEARRTIVDDVGSNAVAAGTLDARGEDLALGDVAALDVELSVLSPLEPMEVQSEEEALAAMRPGEDGIVIEMAGRRATFLPSMWPRLPTPRVFLAALKEKAGLPPDAWTDDARMWRYTVDKYSDPAPGRSS